MNRKPKPDFERYLKTLHCEEADRVPLGDWHVDQRPKEAFLGRKIVTIPDMIDFWYTAGFDYITASAGILEPVRAPEGLTSGKEQVYTEYGDVVDREWAHEHEGIITNWEQFEKYQWPSPDDYDYGKWGEFDKLLPKGMKAILLLGKIYTPAWMYMGAETFFNALENNEELIAAIFEKIGNIQFEVFQRVIEHACVGAVINPDDVAHNTGLLVHPRHLRKYLFPWYKKMGDICRDKGLGFVFHSDGDCTEVMEDLIACGFHGFNPIQPNAMDIVEVKKRWGDKLCLIGNLNLDSTLTLGTPEDVRAEVFERIRTIAPGGGYMVASSNSVTDYVPLANMRAMFDACFEFGQYPIDLSEGAVKGKVWKYQGKGAPAQSAEEPAGLAELDVQPFVEALLANKVQAVIDLVQQSLDAGATIQQIIGQGLIQGMTVVGQRFQRAEIYIPEMMLAAKAMAQTLEHYEGLIAGGGTGQPAGHVVIGTVKGDLHDIGKNLVIMMLKGQGFTVKDLGVSVPAEAFAKAVAAEKPQIVALSALLTTTMVQMKSTLDALTEAGLRGHVKVIIGGAPVTQAYAEQIGADGYAYDAPGAAKLCKTLVVK
ncbi:MAG: cobalamin-dependent protein [Pseudomonadota bacterium]